MGKAKYALKDGFRLILGWFRASAKIILGSCKHDLKLIGEWLQTHRKIIAVLYKDEFGLGFSGAHLNFFNNFPIVFLQFDACLS